MKRTRVTHILVEITFIVTALAPSLAARSDPADPNGYLNAVQKTSQ